MKKQMINVLGNVLINKAENAVDSKCIMLLHEVERPECLKKLDREKLQKLDD